jgi:MFS family permease
MPPHVPSVHALRARLAGSVLGVRDFRRLWYVGMLLYAVRWLEMLAVGVFAYQQTGSASWVAALTLVRLVPMAMLGVPLGTLADRIDRRRALLATVSIALATAVVVAAVAAAGRLEMWHLVVSSFIGGIGWAADNPVRRAMLGLAVGPQRMGKAMSLDAVSNHGCRVVGPIAGGAVLASSGIVGTLVACAVLYSLALLAARRVAARAAPAAEAPLAVLAGARETIAVARADPRLAGALIVTIIWNLWGWPLFSMIPVVGKDRLGLGPEGVGVLTGLDGLGALFGALVVGAIARPANHRALHVGGLALHLALTPIFVISTLPWLTGAAILGMGLAQAAFGITQATIVFGASPPAMRSRMLGLLTMCIGTAPIGVAHVGLLADALGVHVAGTLVALEGAVATWWARRWWRAI